MKKKLFFFGLILVNPLFLFNIFCQERFFSGIFVGPNPATKENAVGYILHSDAFTPDNLGISGRNGKGISFLLYNNQNTMRAFNILRGKNEDITLWFPTENRMNRFTTASGGYLGFATNGKGVTDDNMDFLIGSSGNVGIGTGTTSLHHKLQINQNNSIFGINHSTDDQAVWMGTTTNNGVTLKVNNHGILHLRQEDGVGVPETQYAVISTQFYPNISAENKRKYSLFAMGGILSEDYGLGPVTSWADYVFEKDYKLRDIKDVEEFIETNGHLPDIPSAETISKEGYSLHEMNVKLLQKIEELTLYVIGQGKEIDNLKKLLKDNEMEDQK